MDGDELTLRTPAAAPYARLARSAVAGLAARRGFSFDEVEDLRLAVGEVFALMVSDDGSGELVVTYRLEPKGLAVEVAVDPGPPPQRDAINAMAEQILAATVDATEILDDGHRVVLHKSVADDE